MKRYNIETGFRDSLDIEESENGFWVEWNDVQELKESHKELLVALKLMASHWSLWGAQMDMKKIDFDVVSIAKKAIAKAEGGKPFQSIYLDIDIRHDSQIEGAK